MNGVKVDMKNRLLFRNVLRMYDLVMKLFLLVVICISWACRLYSMRRLGWRICIVDGLLVMVRLILNERKYYA